MCIVNDVYKYDHSYILSGLKLKKKIKATIPTWIVKYILAINLEQLKPCSFESAKKNINPMQSANTCGKRLMLEYLVVRSQYMITMVIISTSICFFSSM